MASELLKNRALIQRLKEPDVPVVNFALDEVEIETILPEPKPEELLNIQEENRKGRLLDSLNKIGGGLMNESVDFIKRNEMAIGGGVIEGEDLGTREGFRIPKDIPKNMVKFFKRPKEMQELLNKYAKFLYKKPYIRLNEKEQGIVKGRAKRGFFTTKDDIREVSTKAEIEKYTKAFPEINFDFKKHPRYGVPLKLPNGKINPEYTSAFNFRRRGYKKNLSKKSLPVSKQRDIVAKFNLPPGVKEWNFDVDRGGYLYGIPDTAGKNRNLGERIKNFTKNPVTYKVSADFSDPAGWMLLQMNRSYEDALAKGLEPEFKPIYDKINNKKRVVGFVDNKYGGGKSYFAGQKYIKKFNGTSMRDHPDYNNVRKFFNITEKARLKPNKVITDLLVRGGIGEDRLTLNSVLNYLINEKGVQPAKKAVVLHHKGGIGNPTRDLQIINALANNQVKGIENAMRRDPKNITPENIKKLKNFGVSVTIDGKTYGGGPKTALGGFKATEKFVEEKIKGFTEKDFTKLKTYLAAMSTRPQCKAKFFSLGGRAGFQEGTGTLDFCARDGAKVINSGNIKSGSQSRNFANFFNKAYKLGRGVLKFGVIPEALFIGGETLIRMGLGDTLDEAFLRATDFIRPNDQTREANERQINRLMGPENAKYMLNLRNFQRAQEELNNVIGAQESELAFAGTDFDEMSLGESQTDIMERYKSRIEEKEKAVLDATISQPETLFAQSLEDEFADIKGVRRGKVGPQLRQQLNVVDPEDPLSVDLVTPEITQEQLNERIVGQQPTVAEEIFGDVADDFKSSPQQILDFFRAQEETAKSVDDAVKKIRKKQFEEAYQDSALAEQLLGFSRTFAGEPVDLENYEPSDRFQDFEMNRGIYSLGGRIGFAKGPKDPGRRTFMKLMAGIMSIPIVGKFFKPVAPVVKQLSNTTTKMPEWFPSFVERAFEKGIAKKIDADITEIDIPELPSVKVRKYDDGRIEVEGKNGYGETYEIDYTPPGYELIDETTGKAVKTPGEFQANDTVYRRVGPEGDDFDVDFEVVDDVEQILGGDSTKLEGFAKGTNESKYTQGQRNIDAAEAIQERADEFDPYKDVDPTDFYED